MSAFFAKKEGIMQLLTTSKKSYKIMNNILLNKSFVIYKKMSIILYPKMRCYLWDNPI